MPRARALCKTPAKKRFIWQRSTLPLTDFVSQPCFNMDTSNKIRVVDRDTFRMTRTYSGGVRDPSDPKHYPTLVGTEGAVGAAASKRTLSTPGSFKETLLVRHDNPKLRIGTQFPPGAYASPSSHPPICRGQIRERPIRRMSMQNHRRQYRPTDLSRGTSRFRAALAGQEVLD